MAFYSRHTSRKRMPGEDLNLLCRDFLAIKLALSIDKRSSTNNVFPSSGTIVVKSRFLFRIKKAFESCDGNSTNHAFRLVNAVVDIATSNLRGSLAIGK